MTHYELESILEPGTKPPLRSLRLVVRTSAFHAENTGSIPVGSANPYTTWRE